MGLLSDYAAANGGLGGLLASLGPAPKIQLATPPSDIQGLLASMGFGQGASMPQMAGGDTVQAQPMPDVAMPQPAPQASPQTGQPAGAPQLAPSQGQPHPGFLRSLVSGVGNVLKLPLDVANAYSAAAGAVPGNIAFERAQREMQMAMMGQRLKLLQDPTMGGLLQPQGGSPPPSLMPPSGAGAMPPGPGIMPPAAGLDSGGAPALPPPGGVAPRPVGPINMPAPMASGGRPALDIHNPQTQAAIARMEMLGMPEGQALATFGASIAPKYSDARPGSMARNEATGEIIGSSVPQDGTYNAPDGRGGFISAPVAGAATNNAAYQGAAAGGKAAGEAIGRLPYAGQLAYAEAAGQGAANDPRTLVTVPMPDGSSRTMTRAQAMQQFGAAGSPGPGPSGPPVGAGFGVSQSPAAAAFAGDQAKDLSAVISADQGARDKAQQTRDAGLRALQIAQSTPFNPGAPVRFDLEKMASVLGIPSKDMNNLAAYQQLSVGATLAAAKTGLPTRYTQQELALVKPVVGSIKDPNIAAEMAAALQTAAANRALARAAYADGYNPQSGLSRQQYEAGWANTHAGRSPLFADPVFTQFKIGGQPAVVPFKDRNGQPRLAITPGLGKPTIISPTYGP